MAEIGSDHRITISLGFTQIMTAILLILAALVGFYVFGVMQGRQSCPVPFEVASQPASAPQREQDSSILKAHELVFAQDLRDQTVRPIIPQPKAPETPAVEQPKNLEEPVRLPASENQGTPPAYHDYVFQMAALKDSGAVDGLRERLEGRGLRTKIERSGKMMIILVLLRGDEARALEVGQIARDLRLGQPLLRSRKPVER